MRPLLVTLCVVALAPAAPVPKGVKKASDVELLVGTWKCFNENGQEGRNVFLQTFVFEPGGRLRMIDRDGHESAWTWTVDPVQSPKRMGWVANPPSSGRSDCVYQLDGDSLKVAFVLRGREQPEQLDASQGYFVYQMTRDTSGK